MSTTKCARDGLVGNLQKQMNTWLDKDDDHSRQSLRKAALKVAHALDTPAEICERISFEPVTAVTIVTSLDAGWLSHLVQRGCPVSASELASVTNCSRDFLIRFMRVLIVQSIIDEHDTETYQANDVTRYLADEVTKEYTIHVSMLHAKAVMQIPQWARRLKFREPMTATEGPFASSFQKPFWETLDNDPKANSAFNLAMDRFHNDDVTKADLSILYQDLVDSISTPSVKSDVAFVDIGGSSGFMAKAFRRLYPDFLGRVVSQDRATVVELASKDPNPEEIEMMGYDFFIPQPVKKSRAYCLRHILHDWPDADCQRILVNIAEAMSAESRLYIFDMVVPDKGCHPVPALLDIMLLAAISGKERNRDQWERLLASAGMKLDKVMTTDVSTGDSVIVATIADKV